MNEIKNLQETSEYKGRNEAREEAQRRHGREREGCRRKGREEERERTKREKIWEHNNDRRITEFHSQAEKGKRLKSYQNINK